jgi:hypothetical protein
VPALPLCSSRGGGGAGEGCGVLFGVCGETEQEEEQDLLEVRRRWGLLSEELGLQKLLGTLSHLREDLPRAPELLCLYKTG